MRRFQLQNRTPAAAAPSANGEGSGINLSIEEMSVEQILEGRTVLSVEEEVEVLAEADQLQNQVSQDVAETTRVEDVTDVMLNVADTVETVQEITPAQAMLVDTVSEMAVAGTDGNPDDVIATAEPLLEGTPEEKAVALESFIEDVRKRAGEIWEKIRKFCLEIWNTIKAFFSRIFSAAPRLLHRVKELRLAVAEAKKAGGEAKATHVCVMVGAGAISYPDYQVRDTNELVKGIGELKSLATYAYGSYLKQAANMGEKVAAELKKYDPKKAGEHLKAVATGLQANNFTNVVNNPPTGYLGCFEVAVHRVDKSKTKDLSDAQIVGALRNSGVKIQPRPGKGSMLSTGKNVFATMDFSEMDKTLTAVEGLVKQLVAAEKSSDMKAIEKARADLLEGGNHAAQAVNALQGSDEAGKTERAYALDVMKALMNFNTTLTRWMSELTMPMCKRIYQTSRVSLVLVESSLKQYKGAPAAAAV